MKSLLFIFVCLFAGVPAFAQDSFEGEIHYKIEYLLIPDEMKKIENFLPKEMIFYAKGTKYKLVNKIPEGEDQTTVMDNFDASGFVLMNFLGNKLALINEPGDIHKANNDFFNSEIEEMEGEKEILGYECIKKKLICAGDTSEVFYTEEYLSPEFKYVRLKGLPLEYIESKDGMVVKVTATLIEEKEVSDLEFVIPPSYKEVTKEELEELFEM